MVNDSNGPPLIKNKDNNNKNRRLSKSQTEAVVRLFDADQLKNKIG